MESMYGEYVSLLVSSGESAHTVEVWPASQQVGGGVPVKDTDGKLDKNTICRRILILYNTQLSKQINCETVVNRPNDFNSMNFFDRQMLRKTIRR